MKIGICLFILTSLSLVARDTSLYRVAFLAGNPTSKSLEFREQIKSQLLHEKKVLDSFTTELVPNPSLKFKENGELTSASLSWLYNLIGVDKVLLTTFSGSYYQIHWIDAKTGKVEYRNELPEALLKTLVFDFNKSLDKENIYLALRSEIPKNSQDLEFEILSKQPGQSVPIKISSNQGGYVYLAIFEESTGETVILVPKEGKAPKVLKSGENFLMEDTPLVWGQATRPPKMRLFASREPLKGFQFRDEAKRNYGRMVFPGAASAKSSNYSNLFDLDFFAVRELEMQGWDMVENESLPVEGVR